jgi:1,4-dihydroxy-2-naphthoate octaprenyltransferase
MSIWFAAGFVFCLTGLVFLFLNREAETALALIASIGMISFVAAVVYFGKRISRQDIDWLTRRIAVSLAEPAA